MLKNHLKDRGERGCKKCYLYIVKIDNFHPVLTPSLSTLFPNAVSNVGRKMRYHSDLFLHDMAHK